MRRHLKRLVFVASGDGQPRLWLRPLDAMTAEPLAGTEGASYPFWSPDSRSIGFFAGGKLKRLDIAAGSPQTLADANGVSRGGTWNADGIILFSRNVGNLLYRIPASGGNAVAVTKLVGKETGHSFPYFLPDGRQFLFYAAGTPETAGIYLGLLDSGETKRLTAADTAGVYVPSGWLLWLRAGTLLAQRLDIGRRELTGDAVTVANQVGYEFAFNRGAFSVSGAGLLAYRSGAGSQRQLTWFDRSGKSSGAIGTPDGNGLAGARISPDGRRVVVFRVVDDNRDIWLVDGACASRFTFDVAFDRWPIWSPDGSRIVFDSNRKGIRNFYIKPSSGAGSEDLLLESPQSKTANDWSADGRFILYHSFDPQTASDLWVLPMSGAREAQARQRAASRKGAASKRMRAIASRGCS